MAYRIEFSPDATADLRSIAKHLVDSYIAFGEARQSALLIARGRSAAILAEAMKLATKPHRGTGHDDMLPGLRHVTVKRAILWFRIDETAQSVRVLAIFFGGQDHVRQMQRRLLEQPRS
jgi:plasmid stabilization system protein ParE